MNTRQKKFLGQFDSNFRLHIVEFAKHLTEISKEYDILIFMARKAACLADCFNELQLSTFHCEITSSRILDMNLDWLKNKKIALIDDALITGRTILKALEKLKPIVHEIDVYVLSIDEDYLVQDLVKPKSPYLKFNSEQTLQICFNIVKAISLVPRPYNIDYPLYKDIRFANYDFEYLSSSKNWKVLESTSYLQAEHNILNLTITPDEPTLSLFSSNIGLPIKGDHLIKIRLYASKDDNGYWCQVLPIIILPPIKNVELDKIFNKICENSKSEEFERFFSIPHELENPEFNSSVCRLHLVQYYLGSKFIEYWYNDIVAKIDDNIALEHDLKNINLIFPPPLCDEIIKISTDHDINFSSLNISFESAETEINQQAATNDFDEFESFDALSKLFIDQRHEKKLQIIDQRHEKTPQRYSLNELKCHIEGNPDQANLDKVISSFLDKCIDDGAIVPITYVANTIVYRAFRHGENVEMAFVQKRLCMVMLNRFTECYGDVDLPSALVEKLLVLFVRIGLHKDLLPKAEPSIPGYTTRSIRHCCDGVLVCDYNDCHYKADFSTSLGNTLKKMGFLEVGGSTSHPTLKCNKNAIKDDNDENAKNEEGAEYKNAKHKAVSLGLLMGKLLNENNHAISPAELDLLATCPDAIDALGALAAEIHIFLAFYSDQKDLFFKKFESMDRQKFAKIRLQDAFEALNSGALKYNEVKSDTPREIIDKAKKYLIEKDPLYSNVWDELWLQFGAKNNSLNLIKKLDELAKWLYSTRFCINLIEMSIPDKVSGHKNSKVQGDIDKIFEETEGYLLDLFSTLKKDYAFARDECHSGKSGKENTYNRCCSELDKNFAVGEQLLAEVNYLMHNFGVLPEFTNYENAVHIDVDKSLVEPDVMHQIFENTLHIINKKAKASKEGIAYLFEIPNFSSGVKKGTFFCSSGENAEKWLLKLAYSISEQLKNKVHLKFVFFFHLGNKLKIYKKSHTNEYDAPAFWKLAKKVLESETKLRPEISYYAPVAEYQVQAIETKIREVFKDQSYEKTSPVSTTVDNVKFFSQSFFCTEDKDNSCDVGILTVIPEGHNAVINFLSINGASTLEEVIHGGRTYHYGSILDKDKKNLKIVTSQTLRQRSASAIAAYQELTTLFNPTLMVLLDIGGSINKKLDFCDVFIAKSVICYEKRSENEGFTYRYGEEYPMSPFIHILVQQFFNRMGGEEPSLVASEGSKNPNFKTLFGPIGSGEAIIKSKDAEVIKWLKEFNQKVLGVETEGAGLAEKIFEDGLNKEKAAKGILIIRGVSDKANKTKSDKWRLLACENAMKVLVEILKSNTIVRD